MENPTHEYQDGYGNWYPYDTNIQKLLPYAKIRKHGEDYVYGLENATRLTKSFFHEIMLKHPKGGHLSNQDVIELIEVATDVGFKFGRKSILTAEIDVNDLAEKQVLKKDDPDHPFTKMEIENCKQDFVAGLKKALESFNTPPLTNKNYGY